MHRSHHKNGTRTDPEKDPKWKILQHKISTKTKNKMGESCVQKCITGAQNMRM